MSADGSVRPWLVIALAVTGCLLAAMTAFIAHWRWRPERPAAGVASGHTQPSARTDRDTLVGHRLRVRGLLDKTYGPQMEISDPDGLERLD